MRTLDRYVVGSFLRSAVLLFIAIMALRIVVDLFFNMDEFLELNKTNTFLALVRHIGSYYAYQSLMYFSELGGTIIVCATCFTLAWMNHTNELTAMLASGVSLHRVVLPIVVCAMLVGGLVILDREVLIPPNAEKLVIDPDEVTISEFNVSLVPDSNGTIWWSPLYVPQTEVMKAPILTIRGKDRKRIASAVSGGVGRPAKFTGYREAPGAKPATLVGWDFTAVALSRTLEGALPWENTPTVEKVYTRIGPAELLARATAWAREHGRTVAPDDQIPNVSALPPVLDTAYNMTISTRPSPKTPDLELGPATTDRRLRTGRLNRPMFVYKVPSATGGTGAERILGIFHARSATWVPADSPNKSYWLLDGGRFFYPTELTNEDLVLTQSSRYLDLMSVTQLTRLLELGRIPDRDAAILAKHVRFADPINNLVMLLLALPFILSRERNIKSSAARSLLMVGSYFAIVHICRLVGLPPLLGAFLPILVFGTISAVMLDAVKT